MPTVKTAKRVVDPTSTAFRRDGGGAERSDDEEAASSWSEVPGKKVR